MSTEQELLSEAVKETETEIFSEAFQDEPAPEPEVAEAEPEKEPEQQPRDESGKFTAKEKTEEKPAEVQPEKAEPEQDDHGQIPSWRLREVAEARRAAEAKAEAEAKTNAELKARLEMLERQIQQSKPQQPEPKQDEIDPLIDPQGFAKRMQDSFDKRLQEIQLNNNLAIAHVKHGEKFEKAYNAFLQAAQQGDRATYQSVMSSSNPGEAMVRWHVNQEALKEFGPDPSAYKQKLRDDLLKDPEFLAKAVEAARSSAGAQPRQNTVTQLPPSLSRATGSQRSSSIEDDTDNSDDAVFNYAFR